MYGVITSVIVDSGTPLLLSNNNSTQGRAKMTLAIIRELVSKNRIFGRTQIRSACVAFGLILSNTPCFGLSIVLNDVTPGGMSASALQGFTDAATEWESLFFDPVTVRVDVGFESLGPGVLGSASSETLGGSFSTIKSALAGDATSTDDATAVTNLPTGSALKFLTTDPTGTPVRYLDDDGGANNSVLDVNRANLKALGLLSDDGSTADATITFNSDFSFDFDGSNGISAGTFDFVGIAIHEIGHSLGFVSGVDIVDITSGAGPFAPTDLDPFRVFSVLDLFRYSADSVAEGGGVLDLAVGDTPYFSLDAGVTNLGTFSTGQFNGDGRQASHWKDNLGLGIMDPTFAPGTLGQISALDIQAFDAIGWDLVATAVPEPQDYVLVLIGIFMMRGYVVRRRGHHSNRERVA